VSKQEATGKEKGESDGVFRLGEILLQKGIITQRDLDRALRIQTKLESHKRLGEVFVELGVLTKTQLTDIVKKYRKNIRIGDLLVEKNLISPEDLAKALEYQKSHRGVKVGEYLISEGIINERNFMYALSEQLDMPYIEPDVFLINKSLFQGLSIEYLKKMGIVPFARDEETGQATVIVYDAQNASVRQAVDEVFPGARLAISRKQAIEQTLDEYSKGLTRQRAGAEGPARTIEGLRGADSVTDIVDYLIRSAINDGASDIHIEPMAGKTRVRYRVDGVLVHKTDLPKNLHPRLVSRIKILCQADVAEKRRHQDGRIDYEYGEETVDLRVSIYVTVFGENVVIRVLQQQHGIYDLSDLGMGPGMLDRFTTNALDIPSGVVLITGPTGSGKTTSLYSAVVYSNKIDTKIISVEDPVEYVIEGLCQCSIHEKIGLTFMDTLRAMVRQDPDIIVLGEVRDKETAAVAIQAALTGNKVYTTFHTKDSVGALLRLMDMQIEPFLIASTVVCVLAQRLVRKICPECKHRYSPHPRQLKLIGIDSRHLAGSPFYRGTGCQYCHSTGYRGRLGVFEALYLDPLIKDAILQKKPSYELRELCMASHGFVTMQEDGLAKVYKGITTFDEVLSRVPRVVKPRPIEKILPLVDGT